jgi:hypothetical protein
MKNHGLWMIVGCVLPFMLIFILPVLGVSSNVAYFISILLMFGCHLGMMGGHRHGKHDKQSKGEGGEKSHGCH